MNTKRFLGPLDAAADTRFRETFVSREELSVLTSPESHIVYGSKGSGKTALARALIELDDATSFARGMIDLNGFSLQKIYLELENLRQIADEDVLALARTAWRNVLIMQFLELVKDDDAVDAALAGSIEEFLRAEYFSGRNAPSRFLNQLERFFQRLRSIGLAEEASNDGETATETRRRAISAFPPTPQGARILAAACRIVTASHRPVFVCIDGFDSIVEHDASSRKVVFAALVDAIYSLSRDPTMQRILAVKAFLPNELTREARAINWDADKYLYSTRYLHWGEDDLKELVIRRLRPFSRGKRSSFDTLWAEFFPPLVRNKVHGLEESSFAYILRHSQHRPRQLLFHVQTILDEWDRKSNAFKVDGSLIPPTVAASSRRLARLVVDQLEYTVRGIGTFLMSFGGGSNTISFAECFSKIARLFGTASALETRQIFDELFDFGVIGIARQESVTLQNAVARFRFAYAGEGVGNVYMSDDDVVALCPMFHDYCGCTPSRYGAIVPSAV